MVSASRFLIKALALNVRLIPFLIRSFPQVDGTFHCSDHCKDQRVVQVSLFARRCRLGGSCDVEICIIDGSEIPTSEESSVRYFWMVV